MSDAGRHGHITAVLNPNEVQRKRHRDRGGLLVDGKRVFLREYQPMGKDGLGARFILPRLGDGEPVVFQRRGDILFHAELGARSALDATVPNTAIPNRDLPNSTANRTATPFGFTISTHYKVKDMMLDGTLELERSI